MIIGAIILLVGIVIGFFLRLEKEKAKSVTKAITDVFSSKKGIIVDLTPPVELGSMPNEEN